MRVLYPSVLSLSPLSRNIDEVFKFMFEPNQPGHLAGRPRAFPPLAAWEDEKSVQVEAELPGFKLEDVEITFVGNELTIKGKRSIELPEGSETLIDERGEGEFTRTVRLSLPVDAQRVSATMRDGVLRITLPKTDAAQPRRIAVRAIDN